jgi:hypothetical protein
VADIDEALVCVICGEPWVRCANRCKCGGFCTWGTAKGAKPSSLDTTPGPFRHLMFAGADAGDMSDRYALRLRRYPYGRRNAAGELVEGVAYLIEAGNPDGTAWLPVGERDTLDAAVAKLAEVAGRFERSAAGPVRREGAGA